MELENMASTISVHRGELLIIQRIIKQAKDITKLKGALYGLYTESGQPVVQLMCGCERKATIGLKDCQKYLEKEHGLKQIGEWIVLSDDNASPAPKSQNFEGHITLVFDCKGQPYTAYDTYAEGNGANLEILRGNGALRSYKPLTKKLNELLKTDNSPILFQDSTDDVQKEETYARRNTERYIEGSALPNEPRIYDDDQRKLHEDQLGVKQDRSHGMKSRVVHVGSIESNRLTTYDEDSSTARYTKQRQRSNDGANRSTNCRNEVSCLDNKPADAIYYTTTDQWYNKNRKMLNSILKLINSISQIEPEISRDKKTEIMSISFRYRDYPLVIEFPQQFPLGETKIMKYYTHGDRTRAQVKRFRLDQSRASNIDYVIYKTKEAIESVCPPYQIVTSL